MRKPIDTAKAIMEDFTERGSIRALLIHADDNVVYHSTAPATTALSGEFRGKNGILEYFRRVAELMEITECKVECLAEIDRRVIVIGSEQERIRSTGEMVSSQFCVVFSFHGEFVAEVSVIEDFSRLALSLGKHNRTPA